MNHNQLPIGVFDSGVGGLTVLRELQRRLPHESFLYLGDTARVPYGTKSPQTIITYAKQANQILLDRGVKLLVIACNTASTLSLPTLQETFGEIPIIGVLEPGARAACALSQKGYIAVIATEATVNSQGYQNAIKKIRPEAQVIAQSCNLFVSLAEEGWFDGEIAEAVAERYLRPLLTGNSNQPDCLVLGCTHYPVLIKTIKKVVGADITIVDSAITTAETVVQMLDAKGLRNNQASSKIQASFLVTDAPERFARIATHFLGNHLDLSCIELVSFY